MRNNEADTKEARKKGPGEVPENGDIYIGTTLMKRMLV